MQKLIELENPAKLPDDEYTEFERMVLATGE